MPSFSSEGITDAVPSYESVLEALPEALREQFAAGQYRSYFAVAPTDFDITAGFWARGYALNAHRLEPSCGPHSLAETAYGACQVAWYNGEGASPLSVLTGVSCAEENILLAFLEREHFLPGYLYLLLAGGAERLRQIRSDFPGIFWPDSLGRLAEWEQGIDFDTALCIHRFDPVRKLYGLSRSEDAVRLMRVARAFVPDAGFELAYTLEVYDLAALERMAAEGVQLDYALTILDGGTG